MRIHSAMVVAIVSAWVGVHANAAAAQSFDDRWSVIPKAHAEQPSQQPNQQPPDKQQADKPGEPAQQNQSPADSRAEQAPASIAASPAPPAKLPPALRSAKGSFTGKASFYSYRTGKTASGSSFNRDLLTAAHRTLPFGTKVRVTNLTNNRSVVVTITDRGPKTPGRVLDLSLDAARAIGITDRDGVAEVRGKVL